MLRGAALLMIFVDHIPSDLLNHVTLHAYGFCDAAEVFVLLAGYSSMLAYGGSFARNGVAQGLRRIAGRCARIYLFQIGLLLITLGVVRAWSRYTRLAPDKVAPILSAPVPGLLHGLTLRALPSYLDILPLYIVLLAVFPLIYLLLRRSLLLGLGVSCALWVAAGLSPDLNLPNWMDGKGWYFDPFAWQFLFTIGAALSALSSRRDGNGLPRRRWLVAACVLFLVVAFFEGAPWNDWNMPNLQLFAMASPDKSTLAWPRIVDILALMYLLLSSERARAVCGHRLLWPVNACGRHSLEAFSTACVLALFGRLWFRTHDASVLAQVFVNLIGFVVICAVGLWRERRRHRPEPAPAEAAKRRSPLESH